MRYLYVNSNFDYNNPSSLPVHSIESKDIYLNYYGYWEYQIDLNGHEIVQNNVITNFYEAHDQFTYYEYGDFWQVIKIDILLGKSYDSYKILGESSLMSINNINGILMMYSNINSISVIKLYIILTIFSNIGGIFSFFHFLFGKAIELINEKIMTMEAINIMRYVKQNKQNSKISFIPEEFQLSRVKT